MRIRSMLILATITGLVVPVASQAGTGATAQGTETVTIEVDVLTPVHARLTALVRTRKVLTANVASVSPANILSGSLDESSVSISLRSLSGEFAGQLLCFVSSSKASMSANSDDNVSLKVTDSSCPMEMSFATEGARSPFLRNFTTAGASGDNGFEIGYSRVTHPTAALVGGNNATLGFASLSRVQRFSLAPSASATTPTPPPSPTVPGELPEAPEPGELPEAPNPGGTPPDPDPGNLPGVPDPNNPPSPPPAEVPPAPEP